MQQIEFQQNNWANILADGFLKVRCVSQMPQKLFNITIGTTEVASNLIETDPRVALAQKIAAGLPALFSGVAQQAIQNITPLASRMTYDPKADPNHGQQSR